jgi:hypothetical protein
MADIKSLLDNIEDKASPKLKSALRKLMQDAGAMMQDAGYTKRQ